MHLPGVSLSRIFFIKKKKHSNKKIFDVCSVVFIKNATWFFNFRVFLTEQKTTWCFITAVLNSFGSQNLINCLSLFGSWAKKLEPLLYKMVYQLSSIKQLYYVVLNKKNFWKLDWWFGKIFNKMLIIIAILTFD